jgi:hypothetical protein
MRHAALRLPRPLHAACAVVYSGMVCHAGRYTTVSKSDDVKVQYGLVNVQPVAVEAAVVFVEAVVFVVADGFDSYKSASRSASLAFLDSDVDLAVDGGAVAANAVLALTGG